MRVLLGVSGGIAAYKAPDLVRRLAERGGSVRCALTRAAEAFVSPLSLEIVSGAPVHRQEYLAPGREGEEEHITVAAWADTVLLAPATAHLLARIAHGLADDFLTTTILAFDGPLLVAPAMHPVMWEQAATQENLRRLQERGAVVLGPVEGPLASGEVGLGRMMEVVEIADVVAGTIEGGALVGRKILVTAGPTHEPLDPVRYLANRSSGRMGFALAEEAAARGADVVLVSGPVTLPTPPGARRVAVRTAREMAAAVDEHATGADLVVMAAAVADFRPLAASEKIKKEDGLPRIELEENPDIVGGLAGRDDLGVVVAFAAETSRLEERARAKLARKGVDFIVANDVSRSDIGLESAENEVTVFGRDGDSVFFERRSKSLLAAALLDTFTKALRPR